jgi:hypothetical protein
MSKVKAFYATDRIYNTLPIPGALEGVQALRNMGYKLIIVTARNESVKEASWEWVEKHFPGESADLQCLYVNMS